MVVQQLKEKLSDVAFVLSETFTAVAAKLPLSSVLPQIMSESPSV